MVFVDGIYVYLYLLSFFNCLSVFNIMVIRYYGAIEEFHLISRYWFY